MKVKEYSDFQALEEQWRHLLQDNLLGDNVFLTWEWLSTWWRHFGEGRKLLILLVEDENEVLAIAPLMLSKYKMPGFGSVKKIEFLGAHHSDYNNFILARKASECLRLIMNYLEDTVTDWDWIELREMPEPTQNPNLLETLFQEVSPRLRVKKRICNICPYISLPTSFDLLMKGLHRTTRKTMKYYLRKINKKHHVKLERYDEAGFSVKEAMELFIILHEKRWGSEGFLQSFESEKGAFRNFHMDVAECFADKGWLGLYFLTADDEPVSVEYAFEYGQKMYNYLGGFDPRYSHYSVGNLLIMFLLERCIAKGFTECDLMRGIEPYKNHWTTTYRRNLEIRSVRKGLLSGFFDWVTWNNTTSNLARKLNLSLSL